MRYPSFLSRAALVALLFVSAAPAAEDAPVGVGDRVVIASGPGPRVGEKIAAPSSTHRLYGVERVEGPWLWVVAEGWGVAGWVKANEVVPVGRAVEHFTEAIRRTGGTARDLARRGALWVDRGQYDSAIADLDRAIQLDPKNAAAYTSRGLAWRLKGGIGRAIADYKRALSLAPDDAAALTNRGAARIASGAVDQAITDLDRAINLVPGLTVAYNNRALARLAKGEFDVAIADLDQAIRLDSGYAAAFNNRGLARRHAGDDAAAIADFGMAIRLEPDYAKAYNNRGLARLAVGAYDEAIADFDRAIDLDPDDASSLTARGLARRRQGDDAKAVLDYDAAIQRDPRNVTAFNNIAWILATSPDDSLRDGQRAVSAATIACELTGWKDAREIGTLAAAVAEVGDFATAVRRQEEAQPLYPTDEERERGLARLALYREGKPYREPPRPSPSPAQSPSPGPTSDGPGLDSR